MYLKTITFIIFFLAKNLLLCEAQNSTIKITMQPQINLDENFPYTIERMEKETDTQDYIVPAAAQNNSLILTADINGGQKIYKKVKKGKTDLDEMELRILNRTDTSILNKRELRSVISLLAYEKGDYFFFILDTNMNNDFRDDKVYSFLKKDLIKVKKEDWHKYIIREKMKIEYLFKGNIITSHQYITIYPFSTEHLTIDFQDELQQKFYVTGYSRDNIKVGKFNANMTIYSQSIIPSDLFQQSEMIFTLKQNNQPGRPFRIKKIFDLDGRKFQFDSISGNGKFLFIKRMDTGMRISGVFKNFYIEKLQAKEMNANTIITLFPDDKPLFLDFWGTWCGPCIELSPSIKKLHEKYNGQMQFISIAADNDSSKVLNYIKKNKMDWIQIYQSQFGMPDERQVLDRFQISAYPTFIIIDKSGKVVFRDIGTKGFQLLENFMKKNPDNIF
jgi:thiol-disulfide isomerase/thioredoxin